MRNGVLTLAAMATLLLGLTASASAQARPAAAPAKPTTSGTTTTMPTFELSAGYQFLRTGQVCDDNAVQQTCTPSRSYPFGLAVDAIRNFGALGLVGEGGWSYDSDTQNDILSPAAGLDFKVNTWHLAGGPRWTVRRNARLWPYGQVLGGFVQDHVSGDAVNVLSGSSVSHNSFMLQPGVGATYIVGDGWGVFGQVDYRRVFLSEDTNSVDPFRNLNNGRNDFRFFVGLRMVLD